MSATGRTIGLESRAPSTQDALVRELVAAAEALGIERCSVSVYEPDTEQPVPIHRPGDAGAPVGGAGADRVTLPITAADGRPLGVIEGIAARETGVPALGAVARLAAIGLAQIREGRELRALNEVAERLLTCEDLEETFETIRECLLRIVRVDILRLAHTEPGFEQALTWYSDAAKDTESDLDLRPAGADGPRIIEHPGAGAADLALAWVPMSVGGSSIGYLLAGTLGDESYAAEQVAILERLATQTALWMQNRALAARARAQAERLDALFTYGSDAMLLLTEDRVTRLNPAAEELLGRRERECAGAHRDEILSLTAVPVGAGEDPLYALATPRGAREVEMFTSQVPGDDGAYSILTLRDVTHRRDLDRAKTNFVSMVSHELRTPLNSVLGFADILLTGSPGSLNETQREFLGHISSSSRHLVQLVNDILDLSRMDTGHFTLSLGPMIPGLPARQVVSALSSLATEAEVELSAEIEPDLPLVRADGRRVEQVLINLVGNALRFTPAGGSVRIRVFRDGAGIVYRVADTGPGIPPEEHERIWERFYQPGVAPRLATKGSGLGLTIARSLVEAHNGKIWLESALGAGSVFFFRLPL